MKKLNYLMVSLATLPLGLYATDFGTPETGFKIDPSVRADVTAFYKQVYIPSTQVAPNWQGSYDDCNPGTISRDYQQAMVNQLNWYRAMAGVPANVKLNDALSAYAQAGALYMAVNDLISHNADPSKKCYSADVDVGLFGSLTGGESSSTKIVSLMNDRGNNPNVGHRSDMLDFNKPIVGVGFAVYKGTSLNGLERYGATSIISHAGPYGGELFPKLKFPQVGDIRDGDMITWPNRGYVPYSQVVGRWDVTMSGFDLSSASIKIFRDGQEISVIRESNPTDCQCHAVFVVDNHISQPGPYTASNPDKYPFTKPEKDEWYTVVIDGVKHFDSARSLAPIQTRYEYHVMVYDPEASSTGREEEMLFDWVEKTYPEFATPGQGKIGLWDKYFARCYPNGNCIGVGADGNAYIYTGRDIINVGTKDKYIAQARLEMN